MTARPAPLEDGAVTRRTARLWKYRPIPADEPEPFPEYRSCCRDYPGGTALAAQVRGKKHKHEGRNGDDWYAEAAAGEMLFAAVSDGAGSRKFSRIGARESCCAAVDYLAQAFGTLWAARPELSGHIALSFGDPRCQEAFRTVAETVQQSVRAAQKAAEAAFRSRSGVPAYEAALGRPLELEDFSATLLVAAVLPAGAAGTLTAACQIGDGMIALLDTKAPFETAAKLLGTADSGMFSGETEFLTSPRMRPLEALQSRTKISRGHSDLLLLMTDGVADDYFPYETELRRLYCDLIANGIWEQTPDCEAESVEDLPDPLCYPWVNDQTISVPLHDTRRILEHTGRTLEELWNRRDILRLASRNLPEQLALKTPEARLLRWLDNYVERGSFDDRTLAAIAIKEG